MPDNNYDELIKFNSEFDRLTNEFQTISYLSTLSET